jgi:hypothetical protein
MIKEKKCKGQGKAKSFKGCGKNTNVSFRKYGLCVKCYASFILDTDIGRVILAKATLKASEPRLKLEQAKLEKKNKNSLETLKMNVRNICHEFIRLRDKGKPCISCGQEWHSDFQAGHYYKAELFSTLKFNEYNIHGQCQGCNIRNEGNLSQYAVNLPKRIGSLNFESINLLADLDKQINFKWDRLELNKIRKEYQQKIKDLKK